ncbi:MAG: hypothetical protein ABH840_02310 [Nanoarchaeota archaeon]
MTFKQQIVGKWRITGMSAWDKDYFDEEVPAYIQIEKNLSGNFHFGYVQAEIDGRVFKLGNEEFFEFTFEGYDSGGGNDNSGSGRIKPVGKNNAEGEIRYHCGDDSTFTLRRMKK